MAVTQYDIDSQKQLAIAVTMGIAGALSKEGGLQEVLDSVESSKSQITEVMSGLFDGSLRSEKGEQGSVGSPGSRPSMLRQPRTKRERTTADIQRDIRKLDVIMSKLTGAPVQNPLGGYGGNVAAVSSYDVGRVGTKELMARM